MKTFEKQLLNMNTNNYTIKSQEALQSAVQIAQGNGQQAIEPAHLLKGVVQNGENVVNFIFNKLGVNKSAVLSALDGIIASYPKVSGGNPYLSSDSNRVMTKAQQLASEMGDQYISLEHIFMAIVAGKEQTARLFR